VFVTPGPITGQNVLDYVILPNEVCVVKVKGSTLLKALEFG
jgi:2',3'-cyclic-nucleotide 2'-phosphodiesterase (5'-nucleotidase family)